MPFGLHFDRTNPEAVSWVKTRAARLVTQVNDSTRAAIRRIVARGFTAHLPPVETARLLREVIGLTEDQTEAVWNLRQEILDSPGRLLTRVSGKMKFRVPANGADTNYLEAAVRRYASRLLTYRTQNIARTETIAASNEGQRLLWKQAVTLGSLDAAEVGRKWLAARSDRTCPVCRAMHGQVVGLDEPFILPDGTPVMNPGAHPLCRCATGLVEVALVERVPGSRAATALRAAGFRVLKAEAA